MILTCDFENLVENLKDVAEVVEDGLLSEDARNVIFKLKEDGGNVELIGVNQLITFTRPLDKQYYTLVSEAEDFDNGVRYIQLKSKELLDFLSSYKGLRRTSVEEVSFEPVKNGRVICKVLEKDLENGTPTISSWTFSTREVNRNIMRNITLQKPDTELEEVLGNNILFYTRNMLPLLTAGTSLYSKLCFGEDYVVAFSQTHATLMQNVLGDSLKGVTLLYRAVSFMDKVLCNADVVKVAKTAQHLYFETETSKAFIMYDNRLPDYSMQINGYVKEHAFSLDRVYLKDILKRLRLCNESVEFAIDDETQSITLKNSKFTQDIGLMQVKDMEKVKFKVMPEIISRAILGSDEEFSQTLYVYFCPQPNKTAILVFTDNSNKWFSSISIKPY